MVNPWIEHVRNVAKEKGMTYFEALKIARPSYKGASSKTMKGEEDYTTKKTSKVFHEQGKYVRKGRTPYSKTSSKKLIDFSKIHWGEFTKDWHSMGSKFPTLREFADAVLADTKAYPKLTVKRARFYKNIILKGKGLGMC